MQAGMGFLGPPTSARCTLLLSSVMPLGMGVTSHLCHGNYQKLWKINEHDDWRIFWGPEFSGKTQFLEVLVLLSVHWMIDPSPKKCHSWRTAAPGDCHRHPCGGWSGSGVLPGMICDLWSLASGFGVPRCPNLHWCGLSYGQVAGPMELDTHWLRPHLRESTGAPLTITISSVQNPAWVCWAMIFLSFFCSRRILGPFLTRLLSCLDRPQITSNFPLQAAQSGNQAAVEALQRHLAKAVADLRYLGTRTIAPFHSFWIWGDPVSMGMFNGDLIDEIYRTKCDMIEYIYSYSYISISISIINRYIYIYGNHIWLFSDVGLRGLGVARSPLLRVLTNVCSSPLHQHIGAQLKIWVEFIWN